MKFGALLKLPLAYNKIAVAISLLWEYLGLELTVERGMVIKTGCRISHSRVSSSVSPAAVLHLSALALLLWLSKLDVILPQTFVEVLIYKTHTEQFLTE